MLYRILMLLVLSSLWVGCGSKLNPDNYTKVKNKMTIEEVTEILGKPDEMESGDILGLTSTTYTYENGDARAVIGFINGKVTTKNFSSGEEKE